MKREQTHSFPSISQSGAAKGFNYTLSPRVKAAAARVCGEAAKLAGDDAVTCRRKRRRGKGRGELA